MVSKIADAVIEGKSLRKDEDLDEEMTPGEEKPVVVRRRMEEDAELADETLLGASTLAKLDFEKEEEVAEEVVKESLEEVTEIVVEDLVDVEEEEVIVKKPATKAKKTTKAKATKKAEAQAEVVSEDVEEDASVESEDLDEE
jgi:hypothetical protein